MRHLLLAAAVALSLSGCKSFLAATTGEKSEPEYKGTGEADLKAGNQSIREHDWEVAEKYLEHVKTKYPYSEVAKEAELRLADVSFMKDEYVEAKDRYANF